MFFLEGTGPLYRRIYLNLRKGVLSGTLKPGEKLPSTRAFAEDLGVSRNVAVLAYEQLISEGFFETFHGKGTFVAKDLSLDYLQNELVPEQHIREFLKFNLSKMGERTERFELGDEVPPEKTGQIDFQYGHVTPHPKTVNHLSRLLAKAIKQKKFNYPDPQGVPFLREEISKYLFRHRGFEASPDDILIVNGSQQALDLISRILVDPGDRVIMEEPHYQGARLVFENMGAKIDFCPVDREGLQTDRLKTKKGSYKLIYLTPSHQFPGGGVLSLSRRLELLEWCKKNNVLAIEDDYDSDFRYDTKPVAPLRSLDREGVVVYLGTFAKSLFPALRIGYMVSPPSLRDNLIKIKWLADRGNSSPVQYALAEFIKQGYFERHVRRSYRNYKKQHAVLVRDLEGTFGEDIEISGSAAGLHLLIWFTNASPDLIPEIIKSAKEKGVCVYSLDQYFAIPPERAGLLLGFANLEEAEISKGIKILHRVFTEIKG